MHYYNLLLVRGIIVDDDVPDAVQRIRNVKIYPGATAGTLSSNRFVSISGELIDTTPPGGLEYWGVLASVIDNNPVQAPTVPSWPCLSSWGRERQAVPA